MALFSKPSKVARWATDANRKTEPASGIKDTGWVQDTKPPSKYMNWLHGTAYSWFAWFNERFFDGATDDDLTVKAVSIAGTDVDGGILTLEGGDAAGDGGSKIDFKVAIANQGSGATVRNTVTKMTLDEDGTLKPDKINIAASDSGTLINANNSSSGDAVSGTSTTGRGIVGSSTSNRGVLGQSVSDVGTRGISTTNIGVWGSSVGANPGVQGSNTGSGAGVKGDTTGGTGIGVYGTSTSSTGVLGDSNSSNGVRGISSSGNGIRGESTTGVGVRGTTAGPLEAVVGANTGSGIGVRGDTTGGTGYGVQATADTTAPVKSSFRMVPQDTDPSSGASGDTYINSTTGKIVGHNGSSWVRYVPQVYATSVNENRTGITTLTDFTTNVYQVPANSLNIGSVIRTKITGDESHSGSTSITFSLKFGTVQLFSGIFTATSGNFSYDIYTVLEGIGGSAACKTFGTIVYSTSTVVAGIVGSSASIDTTSPQNLTFAFGSGASANVNLRSVLYDIT